MWYTKEQQIQKFLISKNGLVSCMDIASGKSHDLGGCNRRPETATTNTSSIYDPMSQHKPSRSQLERGRRWRCKTHVQGSRTILLFLVLFLFTLGCLFQSPFLISLDLVPSYCTVSGVWSILNRFLLRYLIVLKFYSCCVVPSNGSCKRCSWVLWLNRRA